jgi:uncharacterized protein involved in exopolysaccharide biosynthesis
MENTQLPASAEAEISLLDLLVTLADNIKLLILGPLTVGLAALAIAFYLPQTFESVAVLQAEPAVASTLLTASVLDPAAASIGLSPAQSVEVAREALRGRIKIAPGRNDKLLTITATGTTPQQAHATAKALLAAAYAQSRPTGQAKTRLEAQLADTKLRLEQAQTAGDKVLSLIEKIDDRSGSTTTRSAELPRSYSELLNTITAAQAQIATIEAQLEGMIDSQLVQVPTLPEKAVSPKKTMIAVGATLATGFLLLLWVFMRNGLRSAEADPVSADKLARIRRALSLRPPSTA